MAGLNSSTLLLLHFNGTDASTTITDSTVRHTVTADGNGQIDTAQSVFGGSSFLMDGLGDGFNSADHADWDLWGVNTESWTIDMRVRCENIGKTQTFLSQYQAGGSNWATNVDNNNRVCLIKDDAAVMQSVLTISADTWYHIAWIKVATNWGIYVNGVQWVYLSSAATATYAASLYGGIRDAGGTNPMDGWFDEVRIQKSNYFNAAPNVGLTNTITVPTLEYTSAGRNQYGIII